MKRAFLFINAVLVVGAATVKVPAQVPTTQMGKPETMAASAPEKMAPVAALPVGSLINANLTKALDSRKLKVGDTITLRVTNDAKDAGNVVLPKGTVLSGRITECSSKADGASQTAIAVLFDKATLKNGGELAISTTVQALAVPYSSGPSVSDPAAMRGAFTGNAQSGTAGGTMEKAMIVDRLEPGMAGVYGMAEVQVWTNPDGPAKPTRITSTGKSLKLDKEARLLLKIVSTK